MSNNRVTRLFMAVMVAGALVGCGSKEVAQEITPVAEASVAEATVEENAVDAAASTEESIVEETVVEEVEPQTEEMKVLAGYTLITDDKINMVCSVIYDEFGNPVKLISNDLENEEFNSIFRSEETLVSDFLYFGEKYMREYAEVTKSEDGKILEMDWYASDGTNGNMHCEYTYNEFGSVLTEVNPSYSQEFTYDENGYVVGSRMVLADGDDEYTIPADEISSDVDEDGTIIHRKVSGVEYYYFYTTIEVPVQ